MQLRTMLAAGAAAPISLDQTVHQTSNILKQISDAVFNTRSLLILVITLLVGTIAGRIVSGILRHISLAVGRQADRAEGLSTVNRLRRVETLIILSIAIVKSLFIILALYFWWVYTHPTQQPTALIGASALIAIIAGGVFGPVLRDLAFGGGMMAEHWFGVGDLITIEPFPNIQGVVERVTLRSTKIRGLNGEIIWISNQNIAGVRIAQKGVRSIALELFVSSEKRAADLIAHVNELLPRGPALLASPIVIMTVERKGPDLWHLTALGEVAPGREWILQENAIEILKRLDADHKKPILLAPPIARFADNDTERKFARAISNAKKTYTRSRFFSLPSRDQRPRKK
ncbi:MAG TPA: mechanosensitive ion channel family protein [Candidatus Saccharimonadales bacterium]|jgi:hypothetical protein|nr:mechanosensitive ion channel family protein [Candidatus Saccharimonadales bacterium]